MLEEILKSINLNLERIASALDKQEKSKSDLSKTLQAEPAQITTAQATVETSVPITPNQTAVPVAPQESFTQEQLAVAMSNAVSQGKMNVITDILKSFGVQALTQINPADYNRLAISLKEAGVEI